MKLYIAIVSLFLVSISPVFCDGQAFVTASEGNGFSVTHNGTSTFYNSSDKNTAGLEIFPGDVVNVEPRTILKISVKPSNTLLEISESTSFLVSAISIQGIHKIDVFYGRVRTKTSIVGYDPIVVNNTKIIPRKENSDFGFDNGMLQNEKANTQNLYCFEGEIDVSKTTTDANGKKQIQVLKLLPKEMVALTKAGQDVVLAKQVLSAEGANLWLNEELTPVPKDTMVAKSGKEVIPADIEKTEKAAEPEIIKEPEVIPADHKETIEEAPVEPVKEEVIPDTESTKPVKTDTGDEKAEAAAKEEVTEEIAKEEPVKEEVVKEEPVKEEAAETTAKEEVKEEPKEAVKEEESKKDESGDAGFFVTFRLDMSMEISYLFHTPSYTSTTIPMLDFFLGLLDTLINLKGGFLLDAHIMFWDIIGIGAEIGLLYNTLNINDTFYHFISTPMAGTIRFAFGLFYAQAYFGILFNGLYIPDQWTIEWDPNLYFETGIRLGLKLGNSAFFITGGFVNPSIETLFSPASQFRVGGGIMFSFI